MQNHEAKAEPRAKVEPGGRTTKKSQEGKGRTTRQNHEAKTESRGRTTRQRQNHETKTEPRGRGIMITRLSQIQDRKIEPGDKGRTARQR